MKPFSTNWRIWITKGCEVSRKSAPAQLALALILEAYTGVSDDEVIEATVMDRRWQLALDCIDAEEAPCGTSLKAALDQDWDQPGQREEALGLVLQVLRMVETWVEALPPEEAELAHPVPFHCEASRGARCRGQ